MGISVKTFSATGEGLEYKKEHSKQALTEAGYSRVQRLGGQRDMLRVYKHHGQPKVWQLTSKLSLFAYLRSSTGISAW